MYACLDCSLQLHKLNSRIAIDRADLAPDSILNKDQKYILCFQIQPTSPPVNGLPH